MKLRRFWKTEAERAALREALKAAAENPHPESRAIAAECERWHTPLARPPEGLVKEAAPKGRSQ